MFNELFQLQLTLLLGSCHKLVAHDDAGAGIPAEERIIVFRRTKRLGFFVPVHGFAQELVSFMAGARAALMQAGLGSALGDDASIIGPFVGIPEAWQNLLRLKDADSVAFAETI